MNVNFFAQLFARLAFSVLLSVMCGFVLVNLWGWFVVPVFDIDQISLIQAMGLCVLVTFLKGDIPDGEYGDLVAQSIALSLSALFVGFVYSQFL